MDGITDLWYYLFTMTFGDLTFLHSQRLSDCDAIVNKYFDGYYTIQFSESGGVELLYDERRHLLTQGTAWFWTAYPGPRIRFHTAPGLPHWHHRYCAFQGPRVARWLAEGLWPTGPQIAPESQTVVEHSARFDQLLELLRRGDRWSIARAVNLLEGMLLELAEERRQSGSTLVDSWLEELLARMEESDELDYLVVAHDYGMSLSTLRRRFRAVTGTPLHEYVVQVRIARARTLLGDTDLPIKAIAEQLGYRDIYFFTRQFRQTVGVPPAAYRRTRQG